MLGTRIILMGVGSAADGGGEQRAEMLCAANHAIPLYWLLPFDKDDIKFYKVDNSQDPMIELPDDKEYPVLITDKDRAISRLTQRQKTLGMMMADTDKALLDSWLSFLDGQPFSMFAVDTFELWCNRRESQPLDKELESYFELLSGVDEKDGFSFMLSSGEWQSGNAISLAGFGW